MKDGEFGEVLIQENLSKSHLLEKLTVSYVYPDTNSISFRCVAYR